MKASWRVSISVWLGSTLVSIGLVAGCQPANKYAPPPPPTVTVAKPVRRPATSYLEYPGTTKSIAAVDIRARVKGFLKELHFQEGLDVKSGQLLAVIDETSFKVAVDVAQAKLDEARATLKKAEQSKVREIAQAQLDLDKAQLLLAEVEERRNRALLARNAGSREDVDKAEATRKKNQGQVEADMASLEQAKADFETNKLAARASVENAKAALENAKIDLGYCRIYAPLDGRITRRLVDVENLVGEGEATVIATIVKDDPIYAYMSVSEADLLRFREQVSKGERGDFRKGATIPLDMKLSDEDAFRHHGKVDYADPAVDPGTGTVQARGIFDNPDHKIVPGLFVRIRTPLSTRPDALLVPESAIEFDKEGRTYLLVVNAANEVEQKRVKAGALDDDGFRVIEEGIEPDARVVVNGLQRARPGSKVTTEEVSPAANPEPAKPKG